MSAAIYEASVRHVRHERLARDFTHRYYLWLVDLDDLPRLPWPLRPFARFDPRDHCGDPDRGIRENLDGWLRSRGVDLAGGTVLMLASARVLGYVFDPLSVFWCYTPDGALRCVVAEVHNTYGERHRYLLSPDEHGTAETAKEFYVSPFLALGGRYRIHAPEPGEKLLVTVALLQGEATPFFAALRGRRRTGRAGVLVRMLLRHPLAPQRVAAAIRRRGIWLWLRGVPVVPRAARAIKEDQP